MLSVVSHKIGFPHFVKIQNVVTHFLLQFHTVVWGFIFDSGMINMGAAAAVVSLVACTNDVTHYDVYPQNAYFNSHRWH